MKKNPLDGFREALGADVVIPNVARLGCLSVPDLLALGDWFDARRKQLTADRQSGDKGGGESIDPAP